MQIGLARPRNVGVENLLQEKGAAQVPTRLGC
jgi:hypothetical protein